MNTHELARELLSRRANDVRIKVLMYEVPEDEDDDTCVVKRVELRDSEDAIPYQIPSNQIVLYDTKADMVVIRAGVVICSAHKYPE